MLGAGNQLTPIPGGAAQVPITGGPDPSSPPSAGLRRNRREHAPNPRSGAARAVSRNKVTI
jgi:hypothetical protein